MGISLIHVPKWWITAKWTEDFSGIMITLGQVEGPSVEKVLRLGDVFDVEAAFAEARFDL